MEFLLEPKAPKKRKIVGWRLLNRIPPNTTTFMNFGYGFDIWRYPARGLTVVSAVEVSEDHHQGRRPDYHISISKDGERCNSNEAKFVCKVFDMEDAEEDNHVPNGKVRNFWKPVAENLIGDLCPCKESEPAMVEDKGDYVWRA